MALRSAEDVSGGPIFYPSSGLNPSGWVLLSGRKLLLSLSVSLAPDASCTHRGDQKRQNPIAQAGTPSPAVSSWSSG